MRSTRQLLTAVPSADGVASVRVRVRTVWFGGQVITYGNLEALSHGVVVQHATCTDDLADSKEWQM